MDSPTSEVTPIPRGTRGVLLVTSSAAFTTPFMSSAANIAMPMIGDEFVLDAVSLGWVATAYLLAAAALLLPFGRLADIRGRRGVFLWGLVVHTLTSLFIAVAPTGAVLIALRAVQGAGGAMVFATSVALLVSAAPPRDRGRLLGINVAAVYLGLTVGPFAGGLLTHTFGWRSLFLAVAALGLITLVFAPRVLRAEKPQSAGEPFGLAASVLYSSALTALMLGFSFLPAAAGIGCLAAGFAALAFFVSLQARSTRPLLDVGLFRNNRVFALSNAAALINYSATFAVTFLMSLALQYSFGLDPRSAGLALIGQPLMMTIVSPLAGRMSDRIEPRVLASSGMAMLAVGLGALVFIDAHTPLWFIVALLAFIGIGFGLFSSPNTNAVMSSVPRSSYGVASSVLATMRLSGQMLSMGIVILVFATSLGKVRITPDQYPRFLGDARIAFGIFAILSVVGMLASLVRGSVRDTSDS